MYKIKQSPEDFIVDEVYEIPKYSPTYNENNPYAYYVMTKRNFNTVSAIMEISSKLKIPFKSIRFCGNKDKQALTTQLISIKSSKRYDHKLEKEMSFGGEFSYIKLDKIGYFHDNVYLGFHKGNEFTITIRELSEHDIEAFIDRTKELKKNKFQIVNVFGEQRFSTNNSQIGKLLIQKEYRKALDLIIKQDKEFGKRIENKLEQANDHIAALRILPIKILTLYVNAYQSFLWNQVAKYAHERINFKFNYELPIFGFDSDIDKLKQQYEQELEDADSNTKKKKFSILIDIIDYYLSLLKKEDVSYRDFVFKQIPQISASGWIRSLYMKIDDFKIKERETNFVVISFKLPKSSYATTVITELFD